MVNASVETLQSNIAGAGLQINVVDTNGDGIKDSAAVTFASLTCQPTLGVHNWIVLDFVAVVLPSASSVAPISATCVFTHQNGTTTINETNQTAAVSVVAPTLTWTTAWNSTWGNAVDGTSCTVTIQHAANSTAVAYNVNVTALLLPYFHLINASVTSSDATAILAPVLSQGWDGIAVVPTLALGHTITIVFSAYLDVSILASSFISSTVQVSYASSPAGGSSTLITNPYTLSVLPVPFSGLVLQGTSLSETTGSGVTMGEYATYTLTVTVPKGTTGSPSVVINVPAGLMSIANVTMATPPTNVIVSGFSEQLISNAYGTNVTALVNFTSIVNMPSNAVDSSSTITFTIVVLVLDALDVGSSLAMTSQLYYSNGTAIIAEPIGATHSVSVLVEQPVLMWNVFWNETSGDAGDIIGCTIVVQHTTASTAVAYDIDISAVLSPYFDLLNTSIYASDPSWVAPPTPNSGVGIARIPVLQLGDFVAVTFSVTVDVYVRAGSAPTAQINANYASAPTQGFKKLLSATPQLSIWPTPETQLALVSTSNTGAPQASVSVGEYVTYHIVISFPEGTILSPGLLVSAVSPNLELVNVTLLPYPANIIASDYSAVVSQFGTNGINNKAVVSFSSIVNQPPSVSQIVVEIVFHILPSTVGTQLQITSSFAYSNGQTTIAEGDHSTYISVVQPVLAWRVAWNATTGQAGDILGCSVVVKHAPSSTADAYNLDIAANLQPYFVLLSSSAPAVSSPGAGWDGIGQFPKLAMGDVATFSFSVMLTTAVRASSVVSNTVALNYTSTPTTNGANLYPLFPSPFYVFFDLY